MKEDFLQFIWQYKLFSVLNLETMDGEPVVIEKQGQLNTNSGPDFFNAKINFYFSKKTKII